MQYRAAVVSLGCNKNLVDSEIMMKYLSEAGCTVVQDPAGADIVFVNTCGFITEAKEESIRTIFEMLELKKQGVRAVFATGCFAKRYAKELRSQVPELDGILGVYDYSHISEMLNCFENGRKYFCTEGTPEYMDTAPGRIVSTPSYSAYLKIADGCSNRCHYCAIPSIRGDYCSRDFDSLIKEARALYDGGVRELIVTAQDSTRYGEDKGKGRLTELLKSLEGIGFKWIRLLYAYPSRISDELLEYMNSSSVICHYLDMPIQHTEDKMLKAMNRHYNSDVIKHIYDKVRSFDKPWALRTTVICGYPGETPADFRHMLDFLKQRPFELLGAFRYSPEEGTVGASLPHQTRASTKQVRFDSVMLQQSSITNELNSKYVGLTLPVLIEGYSEENSSYVGRCEFQAPEVDGCVYVSGENLETGSFYSCTVQEAFGYDLYASAQAKDKTE